MIIKLLIISSIFFWTYFYSTTINNGQEESIKIDKVAKPVELGEEPHWDVKSQKLYYVNSLNGAKIIRYDPVTKKQTYATFDHEYLGPVIPVEGTTDKFIVGVNRSVVIVTWDSEQNVENPPINHLSSVDTDRDDTKVNDGKCDATGRLWIGTMAIPVNNIVTPNRGSLYKIGINGSADNVVSPVSISNGLTWSLKNDVMYYIDTPTLQVAALDFNVVNGTLSNRRVIFDVEKNNLTGRPDGMTIDADGNLWVALFQGKAVIKVDPNDGKLLQKVEMPVDEITSVAFGGTHLEDLYVTTARIKMSVGEKQEKPDSGSLYRITGLGVKGVAPYNCKYSF